MTRYIILLICTISIGVIAYIILLISSLGSENKVLPYLYFGALIITVGGLATIALRGLFTNQNSKEKKWHLFGFSCCIILGTAFFIGNIGNHFYSPIIFRIIFYFGILLLALWFRYAHNKWLLYSGIFCIVTAVILFFWGENYFMCQHYAQCDFLEPGTYLCDGHKQYVKDLSKVCGPHTQNH